MAEQRYRRLQDKVLNGITIGAITVVLGLCTWVIQANISWNREDTKEVIKEVRSINENVNSLKQDIKSLRDSLNTKLDKSEFEDYKKINESRWNKQLGVTEKYGTYLDLSIKNQVEYKKLIEEEKLKKQGSTHLTTSHLLHY